MESANLVGSYPTEDAALAIVRQAVESHGREITENLLLLRETSRGRLTKLAEGPDLADLALAGAAQVP
jgi:hypothetical protein